MQEWSHQCQMSSAVEVVQLQLRRDQLVGQFKHQVPSRFCLNELLAGASILAMPVVRIAVLVCRIFESLRKCS